MLKKAQRCITVITIILLLVVSYNPKVIAGNLQVLNEQPIKVAVFLASFEEPYVADIKKSMEEVEKENEGKVKYEFFDAKRNQSIQNNDIDTVLEKKEVQLILVNLVKQGEVKYAVDRIKEYNIPVVFFGGTDINKIKAYNKAYWIGTDPTKGGVLQGEVIVSLWNNNKEKIDKNKDNNMQYIMLKGSVDDVYAIERTKYSIIEVNKARIKNKELDSVVCSWSSEESYKATKNSLLKFGNNIEMIIANNDSMAIGAIKALLELGYNKGDERMTIPVVGFDGIIEAQELIKKEIMAGTVIQDPNEFAKAFYTVGMNIVNNRQLLDGTEYKTDADGIAIIIPYKGIMISFY